MAMNDFEIKNGTLVKYTGYYTHVVIPDNVTSIGDSAFYDCSRLTSIVIPDSVTSIGDSAFRWCSSLTSIVIPDSVTSIGNSAFRSCSSLTSIVIPDSVSSIGSRAFIDTPWLRQQSDVVIAGKVCICLIGSASHVVIPDDVTSIGDSAFEDCKSLTSIVIPDSVTSIGDSAFYDCSSLTSIVIPDGVTSIGNSAFEDCSSLTSIVIPDSVTSIDNGAFDGCDKLQLQWPNGSLADASAEVKRMMAKGFLCNPSAYSEEKRAEYLKYINGQKKKLLPGLVQNNNVAALSNYEQIGLKLPPAFRDELIDLAANEKKTEVLAWLMDYKSRTADRKKEASDKERTEEQQLSNPYMAKFLKADWNWSKLEDGTMCLNKYKGKETDVVIPPFVGKVPVTKLADDLFSWNASLTSIVIPDSVTSIGANAFQGCTSLTSITLPAHFAYCPHSRGASSSVEIIRSSSK